MDTKAQPHRFAGIDNFRDFGGYPAAGGRRVARGRLYRSAHHGQATADDLAALGVLGLEMVVDLRRPDERSREPSRRPDPFAAKVVENDIGHEAADTYLSFLQTSDLSVESVRAFLLAYYKAAPFEPRHIDLYARYFLGLANADGGVLIHCAAGKDRTGILAALTHHALGVHFEDSIADYLLTNDAERIDRKTPAFGDYVQALTGKRPSDEAIKASLGVEALYLEAAFEAMETRAGSVDSYLEHALGVDGALRERLAHRLVA
jgi:protein tyrosine/serine phosphatase